MKAHEPPSLTVLVTAARHGDLAAFGALVEATQAMAHAVAWHVLGNGSDARDAVQEAYLRAFRRLGSLADPEAFSGWLRRIVVTVAHNHRRRARNVWVPLGDDAILPVLDDAELAWTPEQLRTLGRALLSLEPDERRLCERHYHGRWSAERLAEDAGIEPATMRKRLQRIRQKLRKEIEMDEQRILETQPIPRDLPGSIVELLARPRLVDLPDNPVGAILADLLPAFPGFVARELPELVDLDAARAALGGDAVYIDRAKLHAIEGSTILRYDLTLPLLLETRGAPRPQRLTASGKCYRREEESATHLEAFHQLEVFVADDRRNLDVFWLAGRIFDAVHRALPRSEIRVTPTDYPMCVQAFSLDVRKDDDWVEILAWGEYADWVLRGLGADPSRERALGAGLGLERIAALRYGIDDIRKVSLARVASRA